MKDITTADIEAGATLLDTATWEEFVSFLKTLAPLEASQALRDSMEPIFAFGNRGKAIAMWREHARLIPLYVRATTTTSVTETLNLVKLLWAEAGYASPVVLTPAQSQVALAVYAGLLAQHVQSKSELSQAMYLKFLGYSVYQALTVDKHASALGVTFSL